MKKLALTSLLAVFVVSGANAANVIDNNPLYRPAAGHFYSVTGLQSHSEDTNTWSLGEEFGYGINNKLAVIVKTSATERDTFDYNAWNAIDLGLNYRVFNQGNIRADVYGDYAVNNLWPDHYGFWEKEASEYKWTAGVRGGYVTRDWTVAGHVEFGYFNSESFNWGDDGAHTITLGLNGQYVLDSNWNLTAGVEYTGVMDDGAKNAGVWETELGVNYNIDSTKFVGAYVNHTIDHQDDNGVVDSDWYVQDGFAFGVKFGIDF